MTESKSKSTRRAFFMTGGAALGAGVATAVGAAALAPEEAKPADEITQLRQQLESAQDREAIRQLHLSFTTLIAKQAHGAAAELFDERADLRLGHVSASGKAAIEQVFANQNRDQQVAAFHNAYRQHLSQQADAITVSEDRTQAAATFHVEVELCTPLQGDCTVATMARLQGHVADRRWEAGRFEAKYVKTQGQWKMASLNYMAS